MATYDTIPPPQHRAYRQHLAELTTSPRNLQEFDRWFADETACRSYVFRVRTSRSRGMLFYRLMQQAVTTSSTPYRQLVDGNYKM